jgi:hypothetical protein
MFTPRLHPWKAHQGHLHLPYVLCVCVCATGASIGASVAVGDAGETLPSILSTTNLCCGSLSSSTCQPPSCCFTYRLSLRYCNPPTLLTLSTHSAGTFPSCVTVRCCLCASVFMASPNCASCARCSSQREARAADGVPALSGPLRPPRLPPHLLAAAGRYCHGSCPSAAWNGCCSAFFCGGRLLGRQRLRIRLLGPHTFRLPSWV